MATPGAPGRSLADCGGSGSAAVPKSLPDRALPPGLSPVATLASARGRMLAANARGHLAPHLGAVVVVVLLQVRELVLRAAVPYRNL